jgi:hypothetical protein
MLLRKKYFLLSSVTVTHTVIITKADNRIILARNCITGLFFQMTLQQGYSVSEAHVTYQCMLSRRTRLLKFVCCWQCVSRMPIKWWYDGKAWTALIWLMIRRIGTLFWMQQWIFRFHDLLTIWRTTGSLGKTVLHAVMSVRHIIWWCSVYSLQKHLNFIVSERLG